MLNRVMCERRTFYHVPQDYGRAQSLVGVQSIVAAPILDRQGQVLGALYGERRSGGARAGATPIREVEAKLFELLAYGVASGLARMEQERQLIAERVRFEQFFTPELARVLDSCGADMLAAREAEITVLFCDIKGFSRISGNAGAALAIEWVREVLSALSDCVANFQGVLIDYTGDALEAIWGAPLTAAEHAAQACQAALQMRSVLPELNRQWEARLGERTDICIGINSGRAQVGNIGSRRKFKYGAFGTTVNLAARTETATRHVGVPLLITRTTAAGLGSGFHTRRLCTVRTVNIGEPVDLFELTAAPDAAWQSLKTRYEQALELFEQQRFADAGKLLGTLAAEFPADEPARKLRERNAACLSQAPGAFDPVWNLGSK
jgi:adenylate cyclase